MSKKYIFIPHEIDFTEFSYSQSMLICFASKNEENVTEISKLLYHGKPDRLNKDAAVIKKVHPYILTVRNWQENRDKNRDRNSAPPYYKMKVATFYKILNDKNIHKSELIIILYFLRMYKNTFKRKHEIKLKDMMTELFGENYRHFNKNLLKTLEILKSWTYEDGSVFLLDYCINRGILTVNFDKK